MESKDKKIRNTGRRTRRKLISPERERMVFGDGFGRKRGKEAFRGVGEVFRRKGLRQQRRREELFGGHEHGSFGGKRGEIAKEEMEALIVGRKTQHRSNIHMLAWLPACFSLYRS
ncbi:hypothetical protein PVK06_044067 [Gossypium arboreum]|uniref:Uncharacterized protein n=1 Tax=Gossypium arboreum TaxID=29729 RepID=A0ABR0MQ92_GOSAR|nr:hypothetical protein PVK06_044067 [Gossypium arboreum]